MWSSRWLGLGLAAAFVVLLGAYAYKTFLRKGHVRELNISCFVFRDINRNGVYDSDDRPYSGLPVTLARPDGSQIEARSNLAGFTNFAMSAESKKAAVREAGDYSIESLAPDGWEITSKNEKQQTRFRLLTESPAGIVAERSFEPVGVAPRLVLKGTLPGVKSLAVENPQGVRQEIVRAADGSFETLAAPGPWKLLIVDSAGTTVTRTVNVGHYSVVVSCSGLNERSSAEKAVEHSVDFESLTTSDTLMEVPRGYGGLDWINWVATHQKLYEGDGFINGTVSGEFVAYNSSGHPAVIENARGFDLREMFVGVAWPPAEGHDVVIRAWRGEQLIHEDRFRASTWGPVSFDADYRNITRLEVSSSAYWQVLVDDLKYRVDQL